jgi:hypothetical protein
MAVAAESRSHKDDQSLRFAGDFCRTERSDGAAAQQPKGFQPRRAQRERLRAACRRAAYCARRAMASMPLSPRRRLTLSSSLALA